MNKPTVDRARLHGRHDMYLTDHYVGLHNMVVSIALAVAGIAVASMWGLPSSYHDYVALLWLMLFASLLATTVAYAGTVTGAPILPPRLPAMLDLILPLLLGLSEFFLFGVLAHQVAALTNPGAVITAWFVASSTFGLLAGASVARARSIVRAGNYDGAELNKVVTSYVRRLRSDVFAAAGSGMISVTAAFYEWANSGRVSGVSYAAVSVLIVTYFGGFASHTRARLSFLAIMTLPVPPGDEGEGRG